MKFPELLRIRKCQICSVLYHPDQEIGPVLGISLSAKVQEIPLVFQWGEFSCFKIPIGPRKFTSHKILTSPKEKKIGHGRGDVRGSASVRHETIKAIWQKRFHVFVLILLHDESQSYSMKSN